MATHTPSKHSYMGQILKYSLVSVVTIILTLSFSSQARKDKANSLLISKQQDYDLLFKKIVDITKKNYVEDVEENKLFYSAFDGMLRSLDPHSGFMNPEDYKEMNIQTRGEFGGVGIEITMDKGLLKIVSPLDDTPAYKAGIKPSDYITMIDGQSVRNLNINQAVQKIRGLKGTEVELTIIREGVPEPLVFSLKRATIKLVSVRSKIIQDDIGYFRITSFSQNTSINLEEQIKKVKAKLGNKLTGVILDLRNNPGGLLDQAVGVSELFLNGGVVVSTKGKNRNATEVFNAASDDIIENIDVIVLINQGSASASEIVAGALQDHNRAIILGTKSFGKGSVQTVIPLGHQLGMRLTTSRYYTPSGRSIQAQGIEPDINIIQKKMKTTKNNTYISESNLPGHLSESDSNVEKKDDNKKISDIYETDYQLARAVDLLHAISVIRK